VGSSLAHVMVVAGTRREWHGVSDEEWRRLADELGAVVAAAGGAWLTVRAYERGDEVPDAPPLHRWHVVAADARCTVIIDPVSDGRERFAEAMRQLPAAVPVDEKAVAGVLYEPADVEPDLVLVLGPPTRLPPSLVWELAYGELVFLPIPFATLQAEHVVAAIEEFHGRRRRFGGLDSEA
jgi:Putative undecaprenyl diphosphate synthase